MSAGGDGERVNAFRVGDRYLFRHYFDGEEVFKRLKPYYQSSHYRFAVPAHRFEPLQVFLAERGYDLQVVDDPADYAVVVEKYTGHPDVVFEHSVIERTLDGHNCFVLTDQQAVEQAVDEGATAIAETDLGLDLTG